MIEKAIGKARAARVIVGICGRAPSDEAASAGLPNWLDIRSTSVSRDSFFAVKRRGAEAEVCAAPASLQAR